MSVLRAISFQIFNNSNSNYFNRKLKIELKPAIKSDVMISKPKVPEFKLWLAGETSNS